MRLDGKSLNLAALRDDLRVNGQLKLDPKARDAMQTSVQRVRSVIAEGKICYGINTGFGALARQQIAAEKVRELQYNLVRSHACGVGEPLPDHIVRRMMILKANSLAVGNSGIRAEVVDTLLSLANEQVFPVIPGKGSVGASGDLAPLAHLALALIGEGEARHNGQLLQNEAVLAAAGCEPIELQAKEGLALLNGTQLSAALAIEGLFLCERLLGSSIIAGALSVEGLAGSYSPFDERIHKARNLEGQQRVAAAFRAMLTASEIHDDHAGCDRVQDPYSLRCMPQVLGACLDTVDYARTQLELECNSVTDNPLVFKDDVISGGNFHAAGLGFVADFLAIALTEIANMSERRIDLLLRKINPKLQMFLATAPGVESGFMIAHVTAAALCSENKTLANPASSDTIPTSAGQEDHVSMAPWAGHKLLLIAENTARVIAIELLAAATAIDQMSPLKTSRELKTVHEKLRGICAAGTADRRLDRDIEKMAGAVRGGDIADLLPGNALD